MFVILGVADLSDQVFDFSNDFIPVSREPWLNLNIFYSMGKSVPSAMIISVAKLRYGLKNSQQQEGKKCATPESTVRGFLKSYRAQKSLAVKTKALKHGKSGKRTILPAEIDEKILEMICNMRNVGVVINFHTVVGFATGIVLANDRILCWMVSKYLQKIKPDRKKINNSKTLDSFWFGKRNWIFFL